MRNKIAKLQSIDYRNHIKYFRYFDFLRPHQGSVQPTCKPGQPTRPHDTKKVHYSLALQDFRATIDQTGRNGRDYSEHSGKRGAATEAAGSGMAENEICDVGNWKNPKTARLYIDNNTPLRLRKHLQLQKLL